jgi:hypothetical protein
LPRRCAASVCKRLLVLVGVREGHLRHAQTPTRRLVTSFARKRPDIELFQDWKGAQNKHLP